MLAPRPRRRARARAALAGAPARVVRGVPSAVPAVYVLACNAPRANDED